MAYRNVYFRIRTCGYDSGWKDDAARDAFKEESRRLFQRIGWTLHLQPNDSGSCDTVSHGDCELYLHPSSFSGIIRDEDIEPLKDAFAGANAFQCYWVDQYEEYQQLSDEEYWAALEDQKEEITAAILERCKTKRSNLFITGSITEAVSKQFEIRRVCDKYGHNNLATKFVGQLMQQLLADGRLVSAQTRYGIGLRTVTAKEMRHTPPEQVEGQMNLTMGGIS